jgi:adenine deaminase
MPTAALGVIGFGATLHAELELLVPAGLTPTQALAAASSSPARAFRLDDRGLIRRGMRADLVLVRGRSNHRHPRHPQTSSPYGNAEPS